MITVTPYDFDLELVQKYKHDTWTIREYLHDTMVDYLKGEVIKLEGRRPKRIKDSKGMKSLIRATNVKRIDQSFVTSLTVLSDHASYVEFGTGLFSEIASVKKPIETRTHYGWGRNEKAAMHFRDMEGDHFFSKMEGQYPKPFMRASVMRLKERSDITTGYEVFLKIVWPSKANFDVSIFGNFAKNEGSVEDILADVFDVED